MLAGLGRMARGWCFVFAAGVCIVAYAASFDIGCGDGALHAGLLPTRHGVWLAGGCLHSMGYGGCAVQPHCQTAWVGRIPLFHDGIVSELALLMCQYRFSFLYTGAHIAVS
jgi:hypothetical protein